MLSGLNAQLPCNSYITVEVTFARDTITGPVNDSSKPRSHMIECGTYGPGISYSLRPAHSSYQIISFMISAETAEGDVMELSCAADWDHRATMTYSMATPGTDVFFFCIKARHTNGKVYTLKPLTIRR